MATDETSIGDRSAGRLGAVARGRAGVFSLRLLAAQWRESLGLTGILLLATALDCFNLSREGFGNAYYAAAVRSMASSWHNVLFSAYDPGGFVSIDKPPVGFWLQVLSVKLFGYDGVSLMLPQALAGVASVALLFSLVRRRFGSVAGLLAALALAVTPISVATNRNNTIDSLLALTLLLAAWAATLAVERGRLRWLLLCMALVGIGFNIKMAEAFVALPAFVLAYFFAAPLPWRKRLLHLTLAGVVLAVVALSWVTAVDLVPAGQRPYVGSSQHNSELELALGYNGINRLLPRRFFSGVRPTRPAQAPLPTAPHATVGATPAPTGAAARPPVARFAAPGFGAPTGGWPVLLRLFSPQLADQLSWLIPLAVVGVVAAAWQTRVRWRLNDQQRGLLLWGAWFLSGFLLFTFDQAARPYYMVTLAPATAALVGLGAVALWHDYRRHALRGWLLPLAIAATAGVEIVFLQSFPAWSRWLTPAIAAIAALAVVVLLALRLGRGRSFASLAAAAATAGVLCLFLAPAVWSGVTVTRAAPGGIPSAGPSPAGFGFFGGRVPAAGRQAGPAGPDAELNVNPELLSYLEANRGDARFLVATSSSQTASPIIIATGQPVMALGGFSGSDPILSVEDLSQLVQDGTVRFFLLPGVRSIVSAPSPNDFGGGRVRGQPVQGEAERVPFAGGFGAGFFGGFGRQTSIESWVGANCAPVPAIALGQPPAGGPAAVQQLYDCAAAG